VQTLPQLLPPAEIGTAQQEIPVAFWDPAKDSLFAVRDNAYVVAVYVDSNKAKFAAEDLGLQVVEVPNDSLCSFWFENSHLTVKY
jgi:hypothetical protein